jgi:hypothetical protein
MKYYIDIDGVVLDTEAHLFDDYEKYIQMGVVSNYDEYVRAINWKEHIRKCGFIKDSIEVLKEIKKEVILLGKYCSQQEVDAKYDIFKEVGYDKPIIFVPFNVKKCDFECVEAKGNVLVDDTIHNLDDWSRVDGYSLYFHKDGILTDNWNNTNTKYRTIKTLRKLYDIDESYFKEAC